MARNYGSTDIYETKENIHNLISRISNNIQNIRQITRDLNDLYAIMGGQHYTTAHSNKLIQSQKKAKDLLVLTKQLFETISNLKYNDEVSKLAVTKTKEEHNNVVFKYNEVHQLILSKLTQMATEVRQSMSMYSSEKDESLIENLETQVMKDDEEIKIEQLNEEKLRKIESELLMVQNMYTDINRIVAEDKEKIDNIEINVISAHEDVTTGTDHLSQAVLYKDKALKKKICIFVTILIILGIIGVIIALSVKYK